MTLMSAALQVGPDPINVPASVAIAAAVLAFVAWTLWRRRTK